MSHLETRRFWNADCGFEAFAFKVTEYPEAVPRWFDRLVERGKAERLRPLNIPELRVNPYGSYWLTPLVGDWIVLDPNSQDVWVTKDCDFKREYKEI